MNLRLLIGTVRRVAEFWAFFQSKVSPLYTSVVRLQAQVAFGIIVCALLFSSGAFFEEPIRCVDRATSQPIPDELLPVCLQYSKAAGYGDAQGPVSQLYSWGHVYLWVVAGLLLAPNVLVLGLTPLSLKAIFLEDDGEVRPRIDICRGMKEQIGKFGSIYGRAILVDALSLVCHGLAYLAVDVLLLNGLVPEVVRAFPCERDMQAFTDAVSLAFPSFLRCDIDPDAHLAGIKGLYYGCFHKTATLYAGAYMLAGVLVMLLSLLTVLHLLYLLVFLSTPYGRRQLVTSGNKYGPEGGFERLLTTGDLMVLEMSKAYLDGRQYEQIFAHLQSTRERLGGAERDLLGVATR